MNTHTQTILNRSCPPQRANSVAARLSTRAWLRLLISLAVVASAGIANASIIAYEPFNYPLGALNNGAATTATGTPTATTGGGFSSTWFAGGTGCTIVGGLTYAGLPTAYNALQWSPSVSYEGENLATAITPATYGTVYVSFLYQAPSYTANKTGIALDNGAGANQGYYMGMTASGTFGVATVDNGSGTVLGTATGTLSFNTTYFVVVEFDKDAGGTYYKSGSIWINPTPGGSPPAASGTFTGSYTLATKFADFLTLGSAVITDEIRIGTTWADVTPASISGPSTPTISSAVAGVNSVVLTWTASTGSPTSYNVKRATTSGGTYTTIGTTTAPTVSYTDTVTGGATYYYEVSAVNGGGESANSSYVSAAPTLGLPSAPTGLAATPGNNQVSLSWTAPALGNPTSYNVLRGTNSGTYPVTNTTSTTSYTDTGLANGTTYYYVVEAVNSAGTSTNSIQVSATASAFVNVYEPFNYAALADGTAVTGTGESGTWTCGSAPAMVTGLTYTGLPTANNALSSTGGRQYVSLASPLTSGTKWISFLFQTSSGNPGANINGVYFPNGGTGLWFGFGLAPYSTTQGQLGIGSMTTTGSSALGATGLMQLGLGTYGNTYLVALQIQFNTSGANDTVTVYLNPAANAAAPGVTAAGSYSAFNVGTITGMGLNVQAATTLTVDEIRTGSSYGEVSGYVPPPTAPTGLAATAGVNSVGLSWNNVSGATGYKVLRGTTSGVYTVTNSVALNTNYDSLTVGGTTYFYVVQATNSSGVSPNSLEVSTTPTIEPPSTPSGLTATGTNGAVKLTWSPATGAASYNVKRATSSGLEVTIANVGTTSYSDTAVVNGTPYFYQVSSTNAAGESGNSSEVSATPNDPPATPTGLNAIAGDNQVTLAWTGSAGAVSYSIKRSTTSGSGYSTVGSTTAPTTAYTDATAVKHTQYFYVISAVSGYGESSNSSPEATATPTGPDGPNAYEPFNYPTGAGNLTNGTAATGTGFAGNWTCGAPGNIGAGLTYPGLPGINNALFSATGRQFANLTSPLSSGTKWISFLFYASGNMGGNIDGVYFPNGNSTCLWFGFGLAPASETQGQMGIGSMATAGTDAQGVTPLQQVGLGTYSATSLIVLKIDFNTSGANDTVTIYTNPVVNASAPGMTAAGTYSSYDVGTISGIGLNVQGVANIMVDEIRVGDTYGDVVGYVSTPPNPPTGLNATSGSNLVSLSWTAAVGSPTGYNVKRSTVSGGSYATIGTTTAPTVTYNDSVLGGQTYYYVVTAVNGIGESTNSAQVSASPILAAPAVPTGQSAAAGDAQVVLSWTAKPFATSYTVKRAPAPAGPYTVIGTTTAPTVTYTDASALNNGTTYYYVVSATGLGGTSTDTAPVSATPVSNIAALTIVRGPGITWFASNSIIYQVQWASALLGTNTVWNNLGSSITGNGATNTVFDPVGAPHNVYQVLSIQ